MLNQRSEIQLDIITENAITNCMPIFVFKKEMEEGYESGNEHYYLEIIFIGEININSKSPVYTLILDSGTYYIGYSNNYEKVKINFALRRMVDYNELYGSVLMPDPYYEGYELGSEVKFNNGLYNDTSITEGFTRNIYLMVEDRLLQPISRLDYDWYSNNEDIAIVTKYGTVLALSVDSDTTVTIYASLKTDPSIVYYKTFTILNDEEEELIEIECNMSYSFGADNGSYKLELNSTNCPFAMVQYYTWAVFNEGEETVNIDRWGYVVSSGPTEVILTGTYCLNPRVRLYINLIIT